MHGELGEKWGPWRVGGACRDGAPAGGPSGGWAPRGGERAAFGRGRGWSGLLAGGWSGLCRDSRSPASGGRGADGVQSPRGVLSSECSPVLVRVPVPLSKRLDLRIEFVDLGCKPLAAPSRVTVGRTGPPRDYGLKSAQDEQL